MDTDLVNRVFYTLAFVLATCMTAVVVCVTIAACAYVLEGGLN